ncbi:nucleotidyltransferase family protein [Kozakia baliensis]|uniref:nucleotidyltransferase family protein n=1 Tax=Kozakia baliensis TaxID=153496 RepID=UPI000497DAD8|nr:nucleotidyltransferase family protein [Kozakia baliensis]
MTLPTLVLAGSRDGAQDPLAHLGGVAHKALLPIVGTPMILRVLNTLRATPGLGPMAVSIENPDAIRPLIGDAMILPTAKGPSGSVAIALERLGAPLLVTTADHPLLRTEWIAQFLMEAEGKWDLAVAVANRTVIERDVPGTKRTYIRLRDLQFSGCNLFWLGTIKARRVVELWQKLERDRKKPWRMAATLGWGILLRAVTGRLTRDALYRRIEKLTGAKVLLIELSDGRAAVDVDKPSDLALVEKILTHS